MGGSKAQVLGYRYYFTIQMGLGRGPIDELTEIRVGDKLAWYGSVVESGSYAINAGKLFGGDKGEGGIEGTFDMCMGEPTQVANPRVVGMRGAIVSALRGVATMVYDGLVCSMNPYPKTWKMRVRRTLAGWDRPEGAWYPERARIYFVDNHTTLDTPTVSLGFVGDPDSYSPGEWAGIYGEAVAEMQAEAQSRRRVVCSMNPVHMLIEIATNKSWGRGMPDDQIDWTAYKVAADTMYCEGFGMCFKWNRQSSLDDVVAEIISTIGAMQYVSRTTGLLTIRLLRDDYDHDLLPVFTRTSGLLSIESAESQGGDSGSNEVVVKYRCALNNEVAAVRYQNLGSVMADGGLNSTTTEYLGIADRNIAVRVAARDVRAATGDIRRLKVTMDRRGFPIEPGTPFKISDPETGIGQMIMRAVTITNEDYIVGTITISCLTDVFGLPDTSYVGQDEGQGDEPSLAPALPKDQRLVEIPYRAVYQSTDTANFDLLTDDAAFIGAVAIQPNSVNTSFDLIVKAAADAEYPDELIAGGWSDYGVLVTSIEPLDFLLVFVDCDLTAVEAGQMALIDDEEVKVLTVDVLTKSVTIARGCLDTVPKAHLAGTRVWFYETGETGSSREFSIGDEVNGKVLSNSTVDQLDPALAQTLTLTTVGRFGKPYPPGSVTVDGEDIFSVQSIASSSVVAFARRNRVTQGDVVQDYSVADISPEAGQTHTINLYRQDTGALLVAYTGITGTSQVVDPGYGGEVRLELFAVRDGLQSHQKYEVRVGSDTPYMTTVAGDSMTTVTGQFMTLGA